MDEIKCPKCNFDQVVKSGIVVDRQRYKCKKCSYHFSVAKLGKKIDDYYVTKALQLYLEGLSYREIERVLGVSHVSVSNWVKAYKVTKPPHADFHPVYKVFNHSELLKYMENENDLKVTGCIITPFGDKFMLIKWERFRD